ncbi:MULTISPECIES: NADH-ubiquinone oxidoreductase-F iron-sulfur binding region domain-containing protein [Caproicibacterium]|uniref:NADH-ubiquinone oxidoreductase-F iron-sulfur binding region domain-containing protein n=1 Tax=Caproicibacterium argilliputei TaxID=3030016 RepID=A0AA97DAR6_9FIRM|nr:NADH-ubiquinone oxidoreductase-F iron-sulfur binding region domain-containing protein [Caproicibacterium argilliputei]WOC32919.1 NADH-ubiquinone oxidoreductase-F iron-sulfur binding region domain-containing protein [Caproicibacterium argilliputei]
MTNNNTEAEQMVQTLSAEEILEKLRAANLLTTGSAPAPAAACLKPASCVVGALENADCDGVLAELALQSPDGIAAGFAAAVKVTGAKEALAALPESCADAQSALQKAAERIQLPLTVVLQNSVNARAHLHDVLLPLPTLAAIADVLSGQQPAAVIFTDGHLCAVPFGTPLRSAFPAVNARAVCINHTFYPAEVLDKPLAPDFPLGSGVIRPLRNDQCIAAEALAELQILRKKSCGKCTFCREGLFQLSAIFEDLTQARGKAADLDLAAELGEAMNHSVLCSLGRIAAAPACSALTAFRPEVEAHLRKKVCPSGACKAFLKLYIDPTLCQGNGDCMDVCPADCIEGKDGFISMIDEFDCTKCGKCVEACPEGAVKYASGHMPPLPERLTRVGRFRKR